ncbi:hypothetical protein P3441_22110 [Vibrio parahaemolyticus]|nr:hypothetical protein [Vibrio parahaemolyticus]MDF4452841.1 hypothetical protein [Vibrio parahaemolyticus]
MIQLEKKGENWREWIVIVDDKSFVLGENGSEYSDQVFNFEPKDFDLTASMLNEIDVTKLPQELSFSFYNVDGALGKYVNYITLCTHPDYLYWGYTWEIEPENSEVLYNPYVLRNEVHKILIDRLYSGNPNAAQISDDFGACIFFDVDPSNWNQGLVLGIEKIKQYIDDAVADSERVLALGGYTNQIVASFNVSPMYQQACSSYLHYFTEFLRDMGVNADSKLDSSDGKILLSITPRTKEESLQRIAEALSLYLNSSEVNTDSIVPTNLDPLTEFKIDKFKGEIDRLKVNLRSAEAIIKYQDSLLVSRNDDSSQLPRTPIEGLYEVQIDEYKQDKKEFLNGGIKLGVFSKAGIEFDWSRLIDYFSSK